MERLLVLALTVTFAYSQAQYSYFNIHRAEVAPLPTFRPFNPSLNPLLVTPPSVSGVSGVPAAPALVETATAAPTSGSTASTPNQAGGVASQLPNSFYFNSFEQHQASQQLNPFLFNGFNSLNHNQAKSISASVPQAAQVPQSNFQSFPRSFPNFPRPIPDQLYGQGFPFNGFNQLPRQIPQVTPQVTTYVRGPQGHYQQVQNQNPFGFGYNPFRDILPPPIIYQIIYYNMPAVNETTTNGPDVIAVKPEATTEGSVVVEISSVQQTSSRIVEEVTPKETAPTTTTTITTSAPTTTTIEQTTTTTVKETEEITTATEATTTATEATTTTTEATTTTTEATTTSTENTTEK